MSAPLSAAPADTPDLRYAAAGLAQAGFAAALARDALLFDLVLLAAGRRARLRGHCGASQGAMSAGERQARQAAQLRLWAECSLKVVDEDLYADALRRRPHEAAALAVAATRPRPCAASPGPRCSSSRKSG